MPTKNFHKALAAVASLGDPVRRNLYEAIAESGAALSRNELAKRTGVARPLVAYHLDRLVKDGLLAVRFERQTGRSGPGAGRPAKLYFRPSEPIQVTLPARDNELAARVLAEAVAARGSDPALAASVNELGREAGARLAAEATEAAASDEEALMQLLAERGYEPRTDADGTTWLRNCVFGEIASRQRELVCGMNYSIMSGALAALPGCKMTATLQPEEGRCCVILSPATEPSGDG